MRSARRTLCAWHTETILSRAKRNSRIRADEFTNFRHAKLCRMFFAEAQNSAARNRL